MAGLTNLTKLDVADADGLTVDSVIVPQAIEVTYHMHANGSLATEAFFVANDTYQVTAVTEVHATAGSDSGTVTVSVTKDTGTAAPGAGTAVLSAAFNLKATINTPQTGSLNATEANLQLAVGDRLAVLYTGTLTSAAGVVVTVSLQRI